ncbi:hypothetical protein Tco_0804179 [Tanacetum coccineum]|uniref:Uncharacterized protein n=1 Tax=Tanacetum coccineum TaxID=301880 RepID=A0ABQ5A672_9ASTR
MNEIENPCGDRNLLLYRTSNEYLLDQKFMFLSSKEKKLQDTGLEENHAEGAKSNPEKGSPAVYHNKAHREDQSDPVEKSHEDPTDGTNKRTFGRRLGEVCGKKLSKVLIETTGLI